MVELDDLLTELKALSETEATQALLSVATVRLEQRRVWLDDRLELGFPPDRSALQPTQLGNVMSRADTYSATRYGIPLRELWPRLELFTSDDVLGEVDVSLSRVDFGLVMTVGGLALFALGAVSFSSGGPGIGLFIALAALGGSLLAYRFAVLSGEAYGKRISAAVDVYRRQTLHSLGIEPPGSIADEKEVWDQLHNFFAQGDELTVRLVPHELVKKDAKEKPVYP